MPRNQDWNDDQVDPIKGPKGDTQFLKSNYKLMGVGGVFRTVKARFSSRKIRAEAAKAGFLVQIDDESPWFKVTVIGKAEAIK